MTYPWPPGDLTNRFEASRHLGRATGGNRILKDWRTERLLSLIETHCRRNDDARALAEIQNVLDISWSRLRHLFKTEVGLSPGQVLKSLRLEQARELLRTTTLRVKEVMTAVGFDDKSYFTRAFKQAFGASPAAYRSRILGKNIQKVNVPLNYLLHARHSKSLRERFSGAAKLSNK